MKNLLKKIFKLKRKCIHEWEISRHQRLTDDSSITYQCIKCKIYHQFYSEL